MPEPAAETAAELSNRVASARTQAESAWAHATALCQLTEQNLAELRNVRLIAAGARDQRRSSLAGRELLRRSELARLLARLETMPVIEQAKGIIMAQSHCAEAEAFDLLRRASQRSNVPVRELAAEIVANATRAVTPQKPNSPRS